MISSEVDDLFLINLLSFVSEILVVLKDTLMVFKYILIYFNFTYIIVNIEMPPQSWNHLSIFFIFIFFILTRS